MIMPTLPLSRKAILVVENNVQVRSQIVRALEIEGYMVYAVDDGKAALELLETVVPDLILCDVDLPTLNGLEFHHAVRKNQEWMAIPFLFLASDENRRSLETSRELWLEGYVNKPIDNGELVKIVNARLLRAAELEIAHIGQAYLETVKVLANLIEGRDLYTHGHVERVARYARWIAEALQWPPEQLRRLEFGARMHDIGKIVVPDHILNKASALTAEEWEIMKQHPSVGAKILRNIQYLRDIVPYVLYHHERWDGSGYPEGLQGRDIPIEGRLLAIADVYDALTTARPYHPARPTSEVIKFLRMRSNVHFDPDLVEIFIRTLQVKTGQPDAPYVHTTF